MSLLYKYLLWTDIFSFLFSSSIDLPKVAANVYSTKLCNRMRNFLSTCPPSRPFPYVQELLISTFDFERELASWNLRSEIIQISLLYLYNPANKNKNLKLYYFAICFQVCQWIGCKRSISWICCKLDRRHPIASIRPLQNRGRLSYMYLNRIYLLLKMIIHLREFW